MLAVSKNCLAIAHDAHYSHIDTQEYHGITLTHMHNKQPLTIRPACCASQTHSYGTCRLGTQEVKPGHLKDYLRHIGCAGAKSWLLISVLSVRSNSKTLRVGKDVLQKLSFVLQHSAAVNHRTIRCALRHMQPI